MAVCDYSGRCKWNFGRVSKRLGKLHYNVVLDDGRKWHRHVDQIIKSGVRTDNVLSEDDEEESLLGFDDSIDHHPVSSTRNVRKSKRISRMETNNLS